MEYPVISYKFMKIPGPRSYNFNCFTRIPPKVNASICRGLYVRGPAFVLPCKNLVVVGGILRLILHYKLYLPNYVLDVV